MFSISEIQATYRCRSSASSIYSFLSAHREGELNLSAEYQREYVWTEKEQQPLLHSLLSGTPLQSISITSSNNSKFSMIIVDGKQRITTLILFFENKIGFKYKGKVIFAKDMDKAEIRTLVRKSIAITELFNHDGSEVSIKDQIDYFLKVNFFGVHQSSEHHDTVIKLQSTYK
jgi:hypothetical protein